VLAVNATKLGHRAPARAVPLDRVDIVVTELDPTDRRLDPYRPHARVL
jgi:DeoR/GlpR family transcriptional regulator of sugar metabolism